MMTNTKLTHRRQDENLETGYVHLFAEEGNEHYGEHVWTLETDLPPVSAELIAWTADYYGIDTDKAEEAVNPSDIVNSADAWDDPQFVSDLWQAMEYKEVKAAAGYRTQDGAVVLDMTAVALIYELDNETW